MRPRRRGTAPGDDATRAVLVAGAERAARALVALLDHPDPAVQRRAACLILDLIGAGCRPQRATPFRITARPIVRDGVEPHAPAARGILLPGTEPNGRKSSTGYRRETRAPPTLAHRQNPEILVPGVGGRNFWQHTGGDPRCPSGMTHSKLGMFCCQAVCSGEHEHGMWTAREA